MCRISISCALHCHLSDVENFTEETLYQKSLKKIASFLFTHPKISFSFYLPCSYVEWLSEKHPEFLLILKDLTNRKQVEILGGGYYEPIFPLILPVDRIGQIEENTTNLRKKTGKRTRGIFLGDSIWDPSLISSFKTCGIDYVIVNSELIPEEVPHGKVHIVEDMGKTLYVIPYRKCIDNFDDLPDPQELLGKIKYYSELNNDENQKDSEHLFFTSFPISELGKLIDSNWLETFFQLASNSPLFDFSTPSNYIKTYQDFQQTFIPAGCPKEIRKWALQPFVQSSDSSSSKNTNIKNFMYTYQEVQYLYSRMTYTAIILTQCKGDKIRKKCTREYLWKAQRQDSYWFLGADGICKTQNRENAYKNLLLAEKSVRETSNSLSDSFLSFDYDMDGRKEYIVHKNDYNAFISLCGGMIFELDLILTAKNYCDTMKRIKDFDEITDFYPKKLFVDHLIDFDHFEQFKKDISTCSAVFSQVVYSEINFDRIRKELVLNANALFGILQQPVNLKKKYLFADNGIKVQYILKNESPLPLKCYFAIESNLCFSGTDDNTLLIEIISGETKQKVDADSSFTAENNVSLLQFSDLDEKNRFVFESNEEAGVCIQPLYITRPVNGKTEKRYQATTNCFFWKIDIPPSYEFEKTIFLGIVPQKKSVKKSTSKPKKNVD